MCIICSYIFVVIAFCFAFLVVASGTDGSVLIRDLLSSVYIGFEEDARFPHQRVFDTGSTRNFRGSTNSFALGILVLNDKPWLVHNRLTQMGNPCLHQKAMTEINFFIT